VVTSRALAGEIEAIVASVVQGEPVAARTMEQAST
jgi:hypothetical protein